MAGPVTAAAGAAGATFDLVRTAPEKPFWVMRKAQHVGDEAVYRTRIAANRTCRSRRERKETTNFHGPRLRCIASDSKAARCSRTVKERRASGKPDAATFVLANGTAVLLGRADA